MIELTEEQRAEFQRVQVEAAKLRVEELALAQKGRTAESPEPIMQFFAYMHPPAHLQPHSAPFAVLAEHIITTLPRNAERTVALRKLLESKDAAVRAALAK